MNGWWAASGLLILFVVLGVGAVIIWGGNGQTQVAAPALPAPTNSASGGMLTEDQTIPTTAPRGVTWDLYRGVAMPISAGAGPTSRVKGIWSGYAHTPTGALLAAAYLAYATQGPDAATVLSRRTVVGPAQEAALAETEATPPAAFSVSDTGAISGFRFATSDVPQPPSYSPETATIQVAGSGVGINMYGTVTLRWVDGDWKLDLSAGFPIPGQGVPSLTGFVPWGAANG
jgi:hypothetical protein